MPAVTQNSPPSVPLAKKRRRDDDSDSITATTATPNSHSNPHLEFPLSSPSLHTHDPRSLLHGANTPHHYHVHALRKVMPLPAVKRIRTTDLKADERQTSAQSKANSPISQDHERVASAPPTTTNLSTPTLTKRCHICGRKPTKKQDLDMFADCEGCRERACFVCMRQCLDWRPPALREESTKFDRQKNRVSLGAMSTDSFTMEDANDAPDASREQEGGHDDAMKNQQPKDSKGWAANGEHRQMICSKCCIEAGKEGDIICLGCLPFVG